MFCSKCGTQALSDAMFCFNCGAALQVEVAVQPPAVAEVATAALGATAASSMAEPEYATVKGWLWWLCVCLTVVTPLATIAVLFNSWSGFQNNLIFSGFWGTEW